jgi:hypothetical protein
LEYLNLTEGIQVDSLGHRILLNTEAKSVVNYNLDESNFSIFQANNNFNKSSNSKDYLSLNIKPGLFIKNIDFEADSLNPPGLISSMKIGIIQSLMSDMSYLEEIENINFIISNDTNNIDFLSSGKIQYSERNGHSIIESIVLSENFIGTVGALLSE